jgi:hypothetical protein
MDELKDAGYIMALAATVAMINYITILLDKFKKEEKNEIQMLPMWEVNN